MKKLLSFVFISCLVLVGCGNKNEKATKKAEKKVLTVGTSSGYAPYEMVDENGELYGFDIDVMNAVAKEAGYELEWEDMAFDGLVPAVQSGVVDVAIAGMTPNEERKKSVDFSKSYYGGEESSVNTNYFLTLASNAYDSLASLKGKKIGVQLGTVQEAELSGMAEEKGFTVEKLAQNADLLQMLKMGSIDAILMEKLVADERMAADKDLAAFEFVGGEDLEGNSIAFKKGSKLKKELGKALKTLKENGELNKLVEKWFGDKEE
ncbi:MAG: transporter substrate-binding domain-containing protein [Breznakia sp.]